MVGLISGNGDEVYWGAWFGYENWELVLWLGGFYAVESIIFRRGKEIL